MNDNDNLLNIVNDFIFQLQSSKYRDIIKYMNFAKNDCNRINNIEVTNVYKIDIYFKLSDIENLARTTLIGESNKDNAYGVIVETMNLYFINKFNSLKDNKNIGINDIAPYFKNELDNDDVIFSYYIFEKKY